MSDLLTRTRAWVQEKYGRHAEHLLKAEEWLLRIVPEANEALRLATVTHDMERAFPGADSPRLDPDKGPADPVYNQAHMERSARVVEKYLGEQQACPELIEAVKKLILAHEFGGWPEADLIQAADSLSFLEVNIDFFIERIGAPGSDWTLKYVREKFDWMYERIQIEQARTLAYPLYRKALEKLSNVPQAT